DHERPVVVELDDAEIRLERGERVVGDLRAGRGDAGNQCGLAGVGKSDEADVGEQLQLETEAALFAGAAGLVLGRGLVSGCGEAGVAASSASAARGYEALAGLGEVEQAVAGGLVVDDGPDRHENFDGAAVGAGFVAAFPVAAALGLVLG